MPALVDHDAPGSPLSIFESGAILVYLAEKSGRFMPRELHERFDVMQWLLQVGGLGPMGGQLSHFVDYAPGGPSQHACSHARYANKYDRLLAVMDAACRRASSSPANTRSQIWRRGRGGCPTSASSRRWIRMSGAGSTRSDPVRRMQRGMDVGKELRRPTGEMSEEHRKMMFGQTGASVLQAAEEKLKC